MSADQGIIGTFARPAEAARAIRVLRANGFDDVRAAIVRLEPERSIRRAALAWRVFLHGADPAGEFVPHHADPTRLPAQDVL